MLVLLDPAMKVKLLHLSNGARPNCHLILRGDDMVRADL
jgi:hypothetical protein